MFYNNGNGMSPADYAAVSGNNRGFGDGEEWLFLLFILAFAGNGFGGFGNNGYEVQQGFDQASIMSGLQAIQATLGANQIAVSDNMNQLAMSLQQCCCQNQLATANLGAAIAAESCATRQTVNDGLRDMMFQNNLNNQTLMTTLTSGFQGLHDEFCQTRLDAKNDKIADLQSQLAEARALASQNAQTAAIIANNEAQTTALERYLAPTPVPAYVVQNPNGCGCNQCFA